MPATLFWTTETFADRVREVAFVTTFSKFSRTMLRNVHRTFTLELEGSLIVALRRNRTSKLLFRLLLRTA